MFGNSKPITTRVPREVRLYRNLRVKIAAACGACVFMNQVTRPKTSNHILRLLARFSCFHEFALSEQNGSSVVFPDFELRFANDLEALQAEVERVFPQCADGFDRLLRTMDEFDSLAVHAPDLSAREILREHLGEPPLEDALLCPLCYYGSARENDMEFAQFVIMFNALFKEGFARPLEGVRRVIRVLRNK